MVRRKKSIACLGISHLPLGKIGITCTTKSNGKKTCKFKATDRTITVYPPNKQIGHRLTYTQLVELAKENGYKTR
jgi:hypothetical protein